MAQQQLQREWRFHSNSAPHRDAQKPITTVAVVGLGYVGLPLAILAASRGYKVIGFDIDAVKAAQLDAREAAFLSDEEAAAFKKAKGLTITSHEGDLAGADAYIICVPTPVHDNRLPDLSPLESACKTVGRHLEEGALVVVESTVNPAVCEEVALPALEKTSGLARAEFFFAHCPERINPGDPRWSVRTIPRVVGGIDAESAERAANLYRALLDAEIVTLRTLKEAEAVKMVENAFRDVNIAFVNELAMAFDKAGIDIVNVIRAASTKPFGFLPFYPGVGVGGHCIPVDPYYLIRYGRKNGFEHRFLVTARRINSGMPFFTIRVLADALRQKRKALKRSKIALLGLSYKPGVGDLRESPAIVIRDALQKRGVVVRSFDPHALYESTARSVEEALKGADAAIAATDHAQFRDLSPRDFAKHGVGILIDGRNCLDKEAFEKSEVLYRGIGR
ncbi:MAG: nucleotide sugar dehydrogenase [Candidatus Kaiserbacteria bacterium]|nr:MAG: nucleotide sugar dehydrogenase [Candidatus Kaiserbacteria bacterium]